MKLLTSLVLTAATISLRVAAESYFERGGARSSLVFNPALDVYLSLNISFSAVEFPDLPKDKRQKWLPVDEGAKTSNEATDYYVAACSNTPAFTKMKAAQAACDKKKCGLDFYLILDFGVLENMDFVRDGILFMSCGATSAPKRCTQDATKCKTEEFKLIDGDEVSAAVSYMNKLGNSPRRLTSGALSKDAMKRDLRNWAKREKRDIKLPS